MSQTRKGWHPGYGHGPILEGPLPVGIRGVMITRWGPHYQIAVDGKIGSKKFDTLLEAQKAAEKKFKTREAKIGLTQKLAVALSAAYVGAGDSTTFGYDEAMKAGLIYGGLGGGGLSLTPMGQDYYSRNAKLIREKKDAYYSRGKSTARRFAGRPLPVRWKRVDGMYVETNLGIVIEKKERKWHWAVERGRSGVSASLKDAKSQAIAAFRGLV